MSTPKPPAPSCKIHEDTGWKQASTAKPERGLHDFVRYITFDAQETMENIKNFLQWVHEHDNAGYCGWSSRQVGPMLTVWELKTTWDSSD